MDLVKEFFWDPIVNHTGYNIVNTSFYALIALISAYVIYRKFAKLGISFDFRLMKHVLPFVLLGSAVRVVTDSVDTGRMAAYQGIISPIYELILNSHVYDYGSLTVTPGIYVWVGLLTVLSLYFGYKYKRMNEISRIVLGVALLHVLLLLPMAIHWVYALLILGLAGGITYAYLKFKPKSSVPGHWLVILGQVLDGSATFVTLDVFNRFESGSYFEQHVFANSLASFFGGSMLVFLLLKFLLAVAIISVLEKEGDREKGFIALLAMVLGFAPGIRDLLRLLIHA